MMSRSNKRSFVILLLVLLLAAFPALRVHAAADEDTLGQIEQQVTAFLGDAYTLPDDGLDTLRTSSSFYEIFVRSWYEDREITGDLVEVVSSEAENTSDGQIIVNSVVDFENYTSDVVIYFDEAEMRPTNYVMNIRYSMAEKMTQAAQNMAVGLIVVFAVLIFLMFIIFLFRLIGPKKKESSKEPAPDKQAAVPATAPAPEIPAGDTAAQAAEDEEIAAVIAAAIAAASEEAPSASGYVVRSVRRGSRSLWKRV